MIEVKNLDKYYSSFKALDNVSFSVDDGQIVGLLGLNGAGKTSLLKILGTLQLPSSGQALIDGVDVEQDPYTARTKIGYLTDVPALYKEMKVISFLRFVAGIKDVPSTQVDRYVEEAMEITNIKEVAGRRLFQLSHGFRQRVGVAQAILCKPKLLILDEPINGLDPIQIIEMRDLFLSLKGKHTVLLSTHIISEVTKTCDRILMIHKGKLVRECDNVEALGQDQIEQMFVELVQGSGQGEYNA